MFMKTKSLLLAFAGLGLFACTNEDVVDNASNGQTASVVIKLDGITSSRAIGDPTEGSDGEGSEINLKNGKILFTDGTKILKVETLNLTDAKGDGQLIHEVPAAVSQVQIVGNADGKALADKCVKDGSLADVKNLVISSKDEQDMNNLPLFGEDTSLEEAASGVDDEEGHDLVYQANVELAPQFSRIEIGNFKCTDLGKLYSKVDIKVVGLLNFNNSVNLAGTASAPVMIWHAEDNPSGIVLEPGSQSVEGKVVFGEADTNYGWAWEKPAPVISMTQANTAYNPQTNKRFVYNFVPQGNVLAALYVDATPKTSAALEINTTLKGKLGTLAPGFIYKVDYTFAEGDITPWNPDETKCVNVNVTVKKWTIKTLTPTFD